MKKNVFRRSVSLLLALLVALGMTSTVFAHEAVDGDVVFFADDYLYLGQYMAYAGAYNQEGDEDVILTSVTSSDPAVAAIVKKGEDYFIKGVSVGKVTITGNYTYKGKAGSLSVPLEVKKVPKMFRSLKLNGKKVTLSRHPFGVNKKVPTATSVRVKALTTTGWRIKSVTARAYKSAKDYRGAKVKVSISAIKNGKKIAFAKKDRNLIVSVNLVNKQTGEKQRYTVQFYRKTAFAK